MRLGILIVVVSGFLLTPIHSISVESYSFESFSIQNPGFTYGTDAQRDLNGDFSSSPGLVVMAYKYGVLGVEAGFPLRSLVGNTAEDALITAEILGKPLFYPNPFSISSGAELGYKLSKNMDVEIRIYDIRANEVFRKTYGIATPGGFYGYNKVGFSSATFGGYNLSAGIYFFVLINEGKVLGRGKFAVKP
jgi:hypothetical protein